VALLLVWSHRIHELARALQPASGLLTREVEVPDA
jgi:hypothetical protein